jgi:hypothetical protein
MIIRDDSGIEVVAGCVEATPVPTATNDCRLDRTSEIGARIRRNATAHFRLCPMPVLLQPTLENRVLMPPLLIVFSYSQTKKNRNNRTGAYSTSWPAMKVSHNEAVMTEGIFEADFTRPKKDVRTQYDNMKSQTTTAPFFPRCDGVSV